MYICHISIQFQYISYSTICHTVSIFHSLLHLAIKFPEGLWRVLFAPNIVRLALIPGERRRERMEWRAPKNFQPTSCFRVQNQLSLTTLTQNISSMFTIHKRAVLAVYSVLYSNSCRVVVICFHVFSSFFPARNKCLGHCFNGLRINRLVSLLNLR